MHAAEFSSSTWEPCATWPPSPNASKAFSHDTVWRASLGEYSRRKKEFPLGGGIAGSVLRRAAGRSRGVARPERRGKVHDDWGLARFPERHEWRREPLRRLASRRGESRASWVC